MTILSFSLAADSKNYTTCVSVVVAPLVVMKAGIINPNNKPPKSARSPFNKTKITYPKFLYNFLCIKTAKEIIKEYITPTICPITRPALKPSPNVFTPDCIIINNPPAIPAKIKPTRKYAK